MKESEHKENIKQAIKDYGYEVNEHDQVVKYVGVFTILISLSRQARVLIESSGCGSGNYWIVLADKKFSYSKTNAEELLNLFDVYVAKCKAFEEITQ